MDSYGAGPVLLWLRSLFNGLLLDAGYPLPWLGLPLAYATYAIVVWLVLVLLRRFWRPAADESVQLRPHLVRIWRKHWRSGSHAWDLSRLLRQEAASHSGARFLGVIRTIFWVFAIRSAIVPWQVKSFRTLAYAGVDETSDWWQWIGIAIAVLAVLVQVGAISHAIRARRTRTSHLRQRSPRLPLALPTLAAIAVWAGSLFLLSGSLSAMPVGWLFGLMGAMLVPALLSGARADRRRAVSWVRLPPWVLAPQLPAPEPVLPAGSATETRSYTNLFSQPPLAPSQEDPGATILVPAPLPTVGNNATTFVQPSVRGKAATVRSWSEFAPEIQPLAQHEPRHLDRYTIKGRIGSGGMAIVYLAVDDQNGQEIALKVASPLAEVTMQAQSRLLSEVMALTRITSPAIVHVHHAGIENGYPFFAMDYLPGPALSSFVARIGPIRDASTLLSLGRGIASGLDAIHRVRVTHRDIKPGNIVLTDQGPVIVDLGIAKITDLATELTGTGLVLGTLGFVPPESHLGQEVTPASDVWSWGSCLAFAATGRNLFGNGTTGSVLSAVLEGRRNRAVLDEVAALDRTLASVIWEATELDPRRRPADGTALFYACPNAPRWPGPAATLAANGW